MPDDRWDSEKNALKLTPAEYANERKRLGELEAIHSAAEIKRLSVPAPEAYELKLPADLKLPDGVTYTIDGANPAYADLRAWANANGLEQGEFEKGLGILAKYEAGKVAAHAVRNAAELAKAGPNAGQRVDVVTRWITSEVGEADAAPLKATLVTDAHLRFYEKMMSKVAAQGAASFSQSHRTAPESNKIPGYENMSFEQRRHAQDQLAQRRTA